jgi:hypothetical protein
MARQKQSGKPGKSGPATSRLLYPKPPLGSFTTAVLPKNQNPQNGQHRARFDWGLGAVCCGASPVASALDLPQKRDLPENRFQPNMPPLPARQKPDISTLQRIGHFYFALTCYRLAGSAIEPGMRIGERD